MRNTIPQPWPPLEDLRATAQEVLEAFRKAEYEGNDAAGWYGWASRLAGALESALAFAAEEQREVLAGALADAVSYRTPEGFCRDCEESPSALCDDHAADLDLTDAYLALARELGIEVQR
jgi:hypothetical protein